MTGKFKKDILKWTEVILDPEDEIIPALSVNWPVYKEIFIEKMAGYLYEDIRRSGVFVTSPFNSLAEDEKSIWFDYVSELPGKLKSLNLFIRPYKDFYRTCIITDNEIEKLAGRDNERYFRLKPAWSDNSDYFFKELNYMIPPQLKKIGFEIVRNDEESQIDLNVIKRLARAIHSRYLEEMRNRSGDDTLASEYPGDDGNQYLTDFDKLPDDIKFSNLDNAYHIHTKLLSIGYKIKPVEKGYKAFTLYLKDDEIETMARVEHIRWSWDKRLNGWIYGDTRNNLKKIHPGLIPYEELSESEKEKDRELVRLIPALLQDIGYVAYPIIPGRIKNLSFAIKPQSSVHKLLNEIKKLNEEIRKASQFYPAIEEKITITNKKIEETISEVQESYNYARHIQETFLPDDLFVRECFPESFILFKPRDIVSGDLYFFSKRDNLTIFAVADCTGHGIPGALLSTLGYGIIDQAVNEIRLTHPTQILHHLYSRVHKFLRRDEDGTGLSDDMDIAICVFDRKTRLLTYSGVNNPIYRINKGDLIEYRAKNFLQTHNGYQTETFESEVIKTEPGDTIYLFSDGYSDQFGGKYHKKYQSSRFKTFLLENQQCSMPEQRDKLYEEIEMWREENDEDQTDDILVIGIRL